MLTDSDGDDESEEIGVETYDHSCRILNDSGGTRTYECSNCGPRGGL